MTFNFQLSSSHHAAASVYPNGSKGAAKALILTINTTITSDFKYSFVSIIITICLLQIISSVIQLSYQNQMYLGGEFNSI
jgi:hypothetical protein